MSTTTNLGLTITPSTAGSVTTFYNWRLALNGESPTSNMSLIDTWAGGVNGSIVTLQGNKPTIYVNGTYVSPGFYTATGITSITAYTTNMFIDLTLDTTITGTTTLNINSLGTKTLQKVDASGSVVNLASGDLKKNKEYIFRYNGSAWIWIGAASADQINIVGAQGNLVSISGSVLVDSGVAVVSGSKINPIAVPISTPLVVTSGSITSASGIVTSGSYNKVFVDTYGRVISASSVVDVVAIQYSGSLVASQPNLNFTNLTIANNTNGSSVDVTSANPSYIINGNFDVWQRGSSFPAIVTSTYSADRWKYFKSGSMAHTITQDTDVPTYTQSGTKSNYSLKIDCTTADTSIAGNGYCHLQYALEGYDYANLKEKQVTLSFWVKATKIGTYCIGIRNSGGDRSYIAEYTISGSETWEKKTISLYLDQSGGTENYTNALGLRFAWNLTSGSTFYTTANAWQTGNYLATSNQVNACDSTSNNFWLSQVKLEIGGVATPLYPKLYADELNSCRRYCLAYGGDSTNEMLSGQAMYLTANDIDFLVSHPKMRAKPTVTMVGTVGTDFDVYNASGAATSFTSYSDQNANGINGAARLRMTKTSHGLSVPVALGIKTTSGKMLLESEI